MKIIDLLNKIAKGEETPKKFKYENLTFEEISYGVYKDNEGDYLDDSICVDFSNLNDEIEIIEEKEDNKIKHIGKTYDLASFAFNYAEAASLIRALSEKQYEIIEYLNERGKQC